MSLTPAPAPDPLAALLEFPGVAAAAESAQQAVDRLLSHGVLRRRSALVAAESLRRGAVAAANLDGLAPADSAGQPPLPALRLYAELSALLPAWRRAPRQALARMHVLVARGRSPAEELGRPRTGPVGHDPLGLGAPPPVPEVSLRLDALAALLVRPGSVPATVLAAVVHGELLTLRPFAVGNGLVASGAVRLTMVARGLDPQSLCVPEVAHATSATSYAAAARGYAGGSSQGVADWLVHCARATEAGAVEGLAICEALRRG